MPFCWVTNHRVRSPIGPYFTEKNGYPANPKTIGEMIRKRRLDLGLRQADAAEIIGCDQMTVVNWEKGHTALPQMNHMAGVVQFLGFNPLEVGSTLAERLVNFRTAQGKTQRTFAAEVGIDPCTLAKWERGERKPTGLFLVAVLAAMEPKAAPSQPLGTRRGVSEWRHHGTTLGESPEGTWSHPKTNSPVKSESIRAP